MSLRESDPAELSSYLKHHVSDLVDWWVWKDRARAYRLAAERGCLVMISSGFASCHGCHHEHNTVFKDEGTAVALNAVVVCIKLDREQHPAVDSFYQQFAEQRRGQRGWPLNVFCSPSIVVLPDGRSTVPGSPFFAMLAVGSQGELLATATAMAA